MALTHTPFALRLAAAVLSMGAAAAATAASVSCRVAVDYSLDGATVETYRQDFTVEPGADFIDDFSTTTRFKEFRASTVAEGDKSVVSISYFSDVDTFDAVSFDAHVTLRGNRKSESTSGDYTFSTSQGVAGNHQTTYTLACRRP